MKLQKNLKKIFCIVFALAMLVTMLPAQLAFMDDEGYIALTAPKNLDDKGYVDLAGMTAKAYQVLDEVDEDDSLFTVNDAFEAFFAAAQETFYKDCVSEGKMIATKIYFSCGSDGNLVLTTVQPIDTSYIEVEGKAIKSLVYNDVESKYFGEAVIDAILNTNTGALNGKLIDSENAATLAEWLRKYAEKNNVDAETATLWNGDGTATPDKLVFDDLDLGYWLIVTDDAPANVANVRSVFRLTQSDSEISAQLKLETQTLEKKVENSAHRGMGDNTTADVGDILSYKATMKIPDLFEYDGNELTNGDTPDKYVYKITDTMQNQWLVDADNKQVSGGDPATAKRGVFTVTISYNGKSITFKDSKPSDDSDRDLSEILKNSGSSYGTYTGAQTFVLDFDIEKLRDLELDTEKGFGGRWEEAELTLEYRAELTSDAVWQNGNELKLEYSNDPKSVSTKPVNDDTDVFTYGLYVKKEFEGISEPSKELADNVIFSLYKADKDGKYSDKDPIQMVWDTDNPGDYKVADSNEDIDSNKLTTDLKVSSDKAELHIYGLDEGYYVLKETKAPNGFATAGDILIYINADGTFYISDRSTAFEGKVSLEAKPDNGDPNKKYLTFTVVNREGMSLPETGGPGVAVLLFGGIALITLAAAMFIYRRKNSAK